MLKNIFKKNSISVFLGSLLFLIHPLQSQAVAYISQRLESLSALFYLLTLYLYYYFRKINKKPIYLVLSCLAALLAILSKETALTLPLALILFDWAFICKSLKKVFTNPYFLLPGGVVFIKVIWTLFLSKLIAGNNINIDSLAGSTQILFNNQDLTRVSYLLTQINVIKRYISLIFVPFGLRLDYDFPIVNSLLIWPTWFNLILLSLSIFLALLFWKKAKKLSFGVFFFFLALIPSSSIFPIEDVIFEHRVYLSMLGVSFMISFLLVKLKNNKYVYLLLTGFYLLLCILTWQRSKLWGDKFLFWQDNYKKEPEKARVLKNYGVELCLKNQCNEGLKFLKKAVDKEPNTVHFLSALAVNLDRTNKLSEAEAEYKKLVELLPENAQFYFLLGNVQVRMEKLNEALLNFTKALEIDGSYAPAYAGMCSAYGGLKDIEMALASCLTAIKIDPNLGVAHQNLYVLYTAIGDAKRAAFHQKKALESSREFGLPLYY